MWSRIECPQDFVLELDIVLELEMGKCCKRSDEDVFLLLKFLAQFTPQSRGSSGREESPTASLVRKAKRESLQHQKQRDEEEKDELAEAIRRSVE